MPDIEPHGNGFCSNLVLYGAHAHGYREFHYVDITLALLILSCVLYLSWKMKHIYAQADLLPVFHTFVQVLNMLLLLLTMLYLFVPDNPPDLHSAFQLAAIGGVTFLSVAVLVFALPSEEPQPQRATTIALICAVVHVAVDGVLRFSSELSIHTVIAARFALYTLLAVVFLAAYLASRLRAETLLRASVRPFLAMLVANYVGYALTYVPLLVVGPRADLYWCGNTLVQVYFALVYTRTLFAAMRRDSRHWKSVHVFGAPLLAGESEYVHQVITDPSVKRLRFDEIDVGAKIGRGGYGDVYRARYRNTDVAVKQLFIDDEGDEKALRGFAKEIELMATTRHPNIVQYLGVCIPERALVMEWMPNGSAFDWMHRDHRRFTLKQIHHIALGTARAVHYLHEHTPMITHRDLKSHNVLLDTHLNAKICDFGLSKMQTHASTLTRIGTPHWMAPEVLRDDARFSPSSDVYSFGTVLWELLTGTIPYAGMTAVKVISTVAYEGITIRPPKTAPPSFRRLVEMCLKMDPTARPTFGDIIAYLEAMPPTELTDDIPATPATAYPPPPPPADAAAGASAGPPAHLREVV